MQGYSNAVVLGNVTRDVDLKTLPNSGTQVGTFSVAVNRTYTTSGEKKEEVSYFDIVIFGKLAPICAKYLHKGDPVFVQGRLQQRSWVTDEGGKKSRVELVGDTVRFLGGKKQGGISESDVRETFGGQVDDGDIPF